MIQKLYSVRDSKAGIFHPPFPQKTHGEAERTFASTVRNKDTSLHAYPDDYDLYYLGEFDDNSGKMDLLDSPQHVVKAVQLMLPVENRA